MSTAIDLNANIKLELIVESATNPRKHFDQVALQELAESISRVGILQAVLVRPRPAGSKLFPAATYELVYGARRYRAARLAGLTSIPCTVRDLTDDEVLEIQVLENLQREDLHPLEEADSIALLHQRYTLDEIATKIGRDLRHVTRRLRISQLVDGVRTLFLEGKLFIGHVEMVAGIAKSLQLRAATRIAKGQASNYDEEQGRTYDEPLTVREAGEMLRDEFLLQLATAPFDTESVYLVPEAGACTVCPKRTSAQQELFAAAAPNESCTDPECWKSKVDADWKRRVAEAREANRKVLKNATEVFEKPRAYDNGRATLKYDGDFVDVDREVWIEGKQTTYRKALGNELDASKLALARDHGGQAHELVAKKDLAEIAKRAGVDVDYNDRPRNAKSPSTASAKSPSKSPKVKEAAVEVVAEIRAHDRVLAAIAAAATKRKLDDGFIRWIATRLCDVGGGGAMAVAKRRGLAKIDPKKFAGAEIRGLVAELIAADIFDDGVEDKELDRQFAHWGISYSKTVAAAVADVKAERDAKSKPPPKGTKPVAKVKPAKKGAK